MKRLSKVLAVATWLGLALAGCGSDDSSTGGTTATGVFVDKPVQGIRYVFDNYSGFTGLGGTFTYRVGTTGTFRVGDIVLGRAPGAPTVTLLDLVKTGNPSLTPAEAKEEATKIAQFLMTLDEDSSWDMVISPQTFNSYTGARFKATNFQTADLGALCNEARPGSTPVSSGAAFAQMSSAAADLPQLRHGGEYVSAKFGDDFVAYAVVEGYGSFSGVVANREGEVLSLVGEVSAAGDVDLTLYEYGTATEVSDTTVTAHSDGAGTITGTAVDSSVTPHKTIPFTLLRVTKATNEYIGVYGGYYWIANDAVRATFIAPSGSWVFGIDSTGKLFGFTDVEGTVVKLTGTVNMATGAITLGAVQGGGSFSGTIAADGEVSGTWTGGTSDHGTFSGSRLSVYFRD